MAVTLDRMEYPSHAEIQAAYPTDAGYTTDLIPVMTGATTPSGEASAESNYGSYDPWKAFDDNDATQWLSAEVITLPEWVQYDFGAGIAHVFRRVTVQPWNDTNHRPKDYQILGSNNGSDWDILDTNQFPETGTVVQTTSFANTTAYRYLRINITTRWASANTDRVGILEIEAMALALQCYSENTIKEQGSYSLKGIAKVTASLNDTLTRTVDPTIDLSDQNAIEFWIRSSRTGQNIKIGIHDAGGVTTEITPNILAANIWQKVIWNISGVANADKDSIDQIIITIVNAD